MTERKGATPVPGPIMISGVAGEGKLMVPVLVHIKADVKFPAFGCMPANQLLQTPW